MNIKDLLLQELKNESASTKKILECVPEGNNDWKPHEKSFHIGRLASHVAEMPQWLNVILEMDEMDMMSSPLERKVCETHAELMEYFETKTAKGIAALEKATDEQLMQEWTFTAGAHTIFKGTRYNAMRTLMFNHQIHHRGQLSVYLRLLDIAIPGMYGPSADDRLKMAAAAEAASPKD